ncbi:MAG: polysaccharide deacetylase family protein [bacterium]|nr:polysaccharide deacetylase family protein [bacterium]
MKRKILNKILLIFAFCSIFTPFSQNELFSGSKPPPPPPLPKEGKVFSLTYHSFLGKDQYLTDISIRDLKSQMILLFKHGFKFVSFDDIIKNKLSGNKNIFVTIDDGNVSSYYAYKEVFKPLGIKPLFAIYPNIIGRKSYALTWNMVRELDADGCEIAAHGYFHWRMTQGLYYRNQAGFKREIYRSKEVLEKELKHKITTFVYPFGVRSPIAKKTIKEAGYSHAFTIVWGPIQYPLNKNPDPYELPRYMVVRNWRTISAAIIREAGVGEGNRWAGGPGDR